MMFEKISRVTSSEVIVEQILEQVRTGGLQPGQKLPTEKEMSELFGVCRTSVREAVRALALMGYLEVRQGKGAYLLDNPAPAEPAGERLGAALAAVDSLDLVDMRNLLECKAVALAADRAAPEQLEDIQRALAGMRREQENLKEFYRADLKFHLALARASNNGVLMEMMNVITDHMVRDRSYFLGAASGDTDECLATAQRVFQAVADGSPEEAVARMAEHLALVSSEIQNVVQGAPRPTALKQDESSLRTEG